MRYFLEIAYDGTNFHGWQIQPNGRSVQEEINKFLSVLTRETIMVTGCGRTDTGVHASQFYLHFDCEFDLQEQYLLRLNHMLPPDVAIKRIIPVHEKAHSRFDATERTYQYRIHFQKNPFIKKYSLYKFGGKPNFELMQQAAQIMLQYEDFWPLCRQSHDAKTTLCKISQSFWREENGEYIYTITANRFLRNMIRLTVGAMLQIGFEKMTLAEFDQHLKTSERFDILKPAQPNGLCLTGVKYKYINE
jgi:tRNA pseudouridine38-40 synthase